VNTLQAEGGALPTELASFFLAPQHPLQSVLSRLLARALPSASDTRRAEVELQIYEALGEIEV